MNPDGALDAELFAWLTRADHEPVPDWEPEPRAAQLHTDHALVARLSEVARTIGAAGRRFVDGSPVIHHPGGRPIAVATGAAWMAVRSARPTGALAPRHPRHPDLTEHGWVELDPWGTDIAFARVVDLLRGHVADAYDQADAEART